MGNNAPDVRVRLSAEGVQDVIDAFRKVSAEAKKTSESAGLLGEAFKDLKGQFLGGIGVAAAIAGVVELGKTALEHADSIGKLSQKIGATAEMLSVLSLAATTAEVSQEELEKALLKLASTQDQAVQGSIKQVDAFHRLGISMQQIKTLDPAQMFVLIANRLQTVESGTKRAALAHDLLGKSGANLIPLLNDLANDGYDKVAAKAQRMGLIIDKSMAEGAQRMHDALTDLGNLAEGFATQFLSGFAPQAADAMESLGNALSEKGIVGGGFKKLGDWVGYLGKLIVFVFVTVGQTVGTIVGSIVQGVISEWGALMSAGKGVIDAIKALSHGDVSYAGTLLKKGLSNAGDNIRAGLSTQSNLYSHLGEQFKQDWADLNAPAKDPASHGGGRGGGDDAGNLEAIARARIAYLKAQQDNMLAITRTTNQLIEQQNERDYRDGLKSLEDYYNTKEKIARADADVEIAALKEKRRLTEQEPANNAAQEYKKKQDLEKLDAEIAQKEADRAGKIKALEDERFNARKQHDIQELESQKKIADLEGNRWAAAEKALEVEIAQTDELLRKQGVAADKIKAILDKIKAEGNARIGFDKASEAGQFAQSDLDLEKRDIQRRADTGQILQIQAQGQILQLEKQRVATLRQIGKELTANAEASGDPRLIEQAKQFNAAVDDLEASTHRVGIALSGLVNDSLTGAMDAFGQFFGDAVTGAKSFSEAMGDMEKAFGQIVAQMIAKLIELYLWMLLTRLIGGAAGGALGGGGGDSPDLTNNFDLGDNGSPAFFGDGGWTGNMSPNKPAGVVHGQEYVVRAGPAARYMPLLEAMNSGSMPGLRTVSGSYATGGFVDPAGGGSSKLVEVNVDTGGQPASVKERQGADGRQIIDVVVQAVAADIQKGGRTAQAMTNTFGVTRKGVKRG